MKSPWQSIDTAPKDGTEIIVFIPAHGVVSPCRWNEDKYAKKPRPYWAHWGKYAFGINDLRANQPTHWIPVLPKPMTGETNEH